MCGAGCWFLDFADCVVKQTTHDCDGPLSKIIPPEESISLDNELVEKWATSALAEVIQLHNELGQEISVLTPTGRIVPLLQVPLSSDRNTFIVNESKMCSIKRAIGMSAGEAMSESEAWTCLNECIQMYDKKQYQNQKNRLSQINTSQLR